MRDAFVADVADFGKCGLLKHLQGVHDTGGKLALGVVWYYRHD